jgi:transcriptional regulator with XRE-family HTH domain
VPQGSDQDGEARRDPSRDLGAFIREQRRVGQLSLRKLSELSGISNPYLSQIERGLRRPSAEILQQIARALSLSAETLYVQAGILDPRDGAAPADLAESIRRAPDLDDDQKRALLHIYESFRTERAARGAAGNGDGREVASHAVESAGPARR